MIIKQNLWLQILIGMALGALLGFGLSSNGLALVPQSTALTTGSWLAILGAVFLGLIGMVIIPLIIASIILGINASRDIGFVKRIGLRLVLYFLATSFIAILIGIGYTEIIKPGAMTNIQTASVAIDVSANAAPTLPMRIKNLIPANPLKAAVDIDLIKVVIFSIFIGFAVLTLPSKLMSGFMDFTNAIQSISLKIIEWAMMIAPLAVFGLIADMVIKLGVDAFIGLGWYVFCVLAGLLTIIAMYLLIVTFIAKRNPIEFLSNIRAVQLLAFSTSSSAATMPFTMQAAEERLNIPPAISRFVVPLGATINMDGTGMYQAVAAVFLCQFFGIELTFVETLLLAFTCVGASIGTPSTPGIGIVVLAAVVADLGVPAAGIGMILGVDRILDMCRTTVNVTGDLTACTVMDRWMNKKTIGTSLI